MVKMQHTLVRFLFAAAVVFSLGAACNDASAASAADLTRDARQSLESLYRTDPVASDIAAHAKEILVFPKIIKAGLVFGGAYGEGVLFKGSKAAGYYNTVSASWGWQAGAQSYGYVLFLMDDKAVRYLHESKGWEIGVGPTVVVVDKGVARNLSSTTLKDDAYAFIFDQQGLMASLSIEGTKISKIEKQ